MTTALTVTGRLLSMSRKVASMIFSSCPSLRGRPGLLDDVDSAELVTSFILAMSSFVKAVDESPIKRLRG
ncbi:hypothetical protein [Corynebacterium glutamicum]|uniref:hypothetical protein n=1 Tax=Corynebacterium glutamicum TaxID=1718 RepID=UPI00156DCCE1|nr:hypothetical protein [Corynebacterium glutamicum]